MPNKSRAGPAMDLRVILETAVRYGIAPSGRSMSDLIREIQRKEGNFACFGTAAGYCNQTGCCWRSLCLGLKPMQSAPGYYSTEYLRRGMVFKRPGR